MLTCSSDVVDDQGPQRASVVRLRDRPVSLQTCRIPYLRFHLPAFDLQYLLSAYTSWEFYRLSRSAAFLMRRSLHNRTPASATRSAGYCKRAFTSDTEAISSYLDAARRKLDADGRIRIRVEVVVAESCEQVALPDGRVSDDHKLEKVVVSASDASGWPLRLRTRDRQQILTTPKALSVA